MLSTIIICTIIQIGITNPKTIASLLLSILTYFSRNKWFSKFPHLDLILSGLRSYCLGGSNQTLDLVNYLNKSPYKAEYPSALREAFGLPTLVQNTSSANPIEKFETQTNTKILFIDHRGTTQSIVPFLSNSQRQLTLEDAKTFIDELEKHKNRDISLILNTPGGSLAAAEVIVNALLNHKGTVTTYIPYMSTSAGMAIALASDKIYIAENAFCGPIDPHYCGMSAVGIINFCDRRKGDKNGSFSFIQDLLFLLKTQAEAAVTRVSTIIDKVVSVKSQAYREIPSRFKLEMLHGGRNHDEPVFGKELAELLPNVQVSMPPGIVEIYNSR
jgi:hypothetical protein